MLKDLQNRKEEEKHTIYATIFFIRVLERGARREGERNSV